MSFDLRTIIVLIIGGGILGATMVLTGVVLCLYFKVSKALKYAKEPDAVALNYSYPAKVYPTKTITTESYPCAAFQCYDGCSAYADMDPLPPCFCSPKEGL